MDCLFCKIVNKEISSEIIYEDEEILVLKDTNPKAAIHFLIVPKKHIESINHLQESDREIISNLIFTAKKIAKEKSIEGYKLVFNVGRKGGQIIDHIHLHFLAGELAQTP
ncbi:HIT domain-containing protein [Candidatus Parcubacteria bacterium]|nr:HIT domain-containing protein [Candidatus Parcubacteria bacterium]